MHNFATTPLAPTGTKVIIHMKPNTRASWDYHGRTGWYIRRAPDHYRCFKCFIPSTGKEIITDSLRFIPTKIHFPSMSIELALKQATQKIITILQQTPVQNSIYLPHKDSIIKAYKQVATTLNNNPKMFTQQIPKVDNMIQKSGPRTWVPENIDSQSSVSATSTRYMPAEPRV